MQYVDDDRRSGLFGCTGDRVLKVESCAVRAAHSFGEYSQHSVSAQHAEHRLDRTGVSAELDFGNTAQL
jgi:hypothetical protein